MSESQHGSFSLLHRHCPLSSASLLFSCLVLFRDLENIYNNIVSIWIIILGKISVLNFVWDIANNSGNFWKFLKPRIFTYDLSTIMLLLPQICLKGVAKRPGNPGNSKHWNELKCRLSLFLTWHFWLKFLTQVKWRIFLHADDNWGWGMRIRTKLVRFRPQPALNRAEKQRNTNPDEAGSWKDSTLHVRHKTPKT